MGHSSTYETCTSLPPELSWNQLDGGRRTAIECAPTTRRRREEVLIWDEFIRGKRECRLGCYRQMSRRLRTDTDETNSIFVRGSLQRRNCRAIASRRRIQSTNVHRLQAADTQQEYDRDPQHSSAAQIHGSGIGRCEHLDFAGLAVGTRRPESRLSYRKRDGETQWAG